MLLSLSFNTKSTDINDGLNESFLHAAGEIHPPLEGILTFADYYSEHGCEEGRGEE